MVSNKQFEDPKHVAGDKPQKDPKRPHKSRVRFEVYGEEMVEKEVKLCGNSGRIYLPPDWVGKQVKIMRID